MDEIKIALIKTEQGGLVHKHCLGVLLRYLYNVKCIKLEYLLLRQMGIKALEMDSNGIGTPFTTDQKEDMISILSSINNNKCCSNEQ